MKKRGFVTIATGGKQYYKMAANLLASYRCFTSAPLPFAIIAENKNEYTALFDDVVITDEGTHSFLDKFLLLKFCPYEETIYVDADSLIYDDLNKYWKEFENATDFSTVGENLSLDEQSRGWYDVADIGKYGKKIEYICRVHSGVCYVRQSERLKKLYADCMDIVRNYSKIHVRESCDCTDEAVFDIAMPMNGMRAINESTELLGVYPMLVEIELDVLTQKCRYLTKWGAGSEHGCVIHWGNNQTYSPLYRTEIIKLEVLSGRRKEHDLKYLWLYKAVFTVEYFVYCLIRKIYRKLKGYG